MYYSAIPNVHLQYTLELGKNGKVHSLTPGLQLFWFVHLTPTPLLSWPSFPYNEILLFLLVQVALLLFLSSHFTA